MATAPTLPFVPVEEYLRTEYEPRYEYLDGTLAAKAMADFTHAYLQALLISFLVSQQDKFGLLSLSELHTRISPTRYRIPDVCVLTTRPEDGRYPDNERPPLLTIEIASKGEPWTDLRGKLADHLSIGVETVIIADPYNKTVMIATQSKPLHELSTPLVVSIAVEGKGMLQLDFDDLYRKL